jgi:hypothetical protein
MSLRVLRRTGWLIGALVGLSVIIFGPAFLVQQTSLFNVQVPKEVAVQTEYTAIFVPNSTDLINPDGTDLISVRSWSVPTPSTGRELSKGQKALMYARQKVWTDALSQAAKHVDEHFRTTTTYVLDEHQTISRARLTICIVVTFVFFVILFLSGRRCVRKYVGRSDSPPRHLLYLIGLGASMIPASEQDEFVDTWIAEIAETQGWERIRFALDLLRVGPRIYQEMLLTRYRTPIENSEETQ